MNVIDSQWKQAQEQIFVTWINEILKEKQISSIEKDLQDGIILIQFVEELTGKKCHEKLIPQPKFRIQRISNCTVALRFIEQEYHLKTLCSAENIVDGGDDIKYLYGLLFQLYLKNNKTTLVSPQLSQDQQYTLLINWLNQTLTSYPIHLINKQQLMDTFTNGILLTALLDCFFEQHNHFYDYMMTKGDGERIGITMRMAHDLLGVTELLKTEDVLSHQIDSRVFFFYFDFIMKAFKEKASIASIDLIRLVEEALNNMNIQLQKEQQMNIQEEKEEHVILTDNDNLYHPSSLHQSHFNQPQEQHSYQQQKQQKKHPPPPIPEKRTGKPIVLKDVMVKGHVGTKKHHVQNDIFQEPKEEYMKPIHSHSHKQEEQTIHQYYSPSTYTQTTTTSFSTSTSTKGSHSSQSSHTVVSYSFYFI